MKVVFDENISHVLTELLARCGAPGQIQHTRKMGWNSTDDDVWMPRAIAAGFAIVTADRNQRTRGLSADDFRAMQARVVLLGAFWDYLGIWEKTKWLVSRWEDLHASLAELPEGSCCIVNKTGTLEDV